MTPTRRTLLAALPVALLAASPAWAADAPEFTERAVGKPDAKVTVQEYFSMTCTHCAEFARVTFPRVQSELIDTGKVRWVFRDYPLDQLALYAAMVARALPPERYEPFVLSLLTTQDRWAFTRTNNPMEELMKIALLAGMSRETFDKVTRDDKLKAFILTEQANAEKKYGVNSTPTFIINDKVVPGAIGYDQFVKAVQDATPA